MVTRNSSGLPVVKFQEPAELFATDDWSLERTAVLLRFRGKEDDVCLALMVSFFMIMSEIGT